MGIEVAISIGTGDMKLQDANYNSYRDVGLHGGLRVPSNIVSNA